MELQEFIRLTLTQIIKGIELAQNETNESGAKINPGVSFNNQSPNLLSYYSGESSKFAVQNVEFDIAVQTESKDESQGTIGIVIADLGLGVKGKTKDTQSSISRIKFSIPVVFPSEDSTEKRQPTPTQTNPWLNKKDI